jgi:predicted HicB family RNase H-like nuclease
MENNMQTTLHVRLPIDLHQQLARRAAAEERPVSWWVRKVLKDHVQRQQAGDTTQEAA